MGVLSFEVMDLDTAIMVEGLIPMTTTSPFACWFPYPSRTSCNLLNLLPWSFLLKPPVVLTRVRLNGSVV